MGGRDGPRPSTPPCAGSASARSRTSTASRRTAARCSFSFEEHATPGDAGAVRAPAADARVRRRARRPALPARRRAAAIEELEREPAAAIFARAPRRREARRGARAVPVRSCSRCSAPLTDACGGFDWDDGVFNRVYAEIEHSLLGERHEYGAAAPLVGLSAPLPVDLGRGHRRADVGCRRARRVLARGARPAAERLRRGAGADVRARARMRVSRPPEDESARRARRVRGRRDRAAARNRGSGRRGADPLRAARLAAVRHPPGAADRGHRARRRAEPTRRVPRPARARPPGAAARRATRIPSWGRPSTAGSCRCSPTSHSAPSCSASRSRRCSAATTGSGPPPRGRRCSSATGATGARRALRLLRGLTARRQDGAARCPTSSGGRSSRY